MVQVTNNLHFCKECNKFLPEKNIFHDTINGEIVCTKCGCVIIEKTDESLHKDYQANTINYTLNHHDNYLNSNIALGKSDTVTTFMKQLDYQTQIYGQNNLIQAVNLLRNLQNHLNLNIATCNTAITLYKKCKKNKITHGINTSIFTQACLYIACQQHEIPRTVKTISKHTESSIKSIHKIVRKIVRELNITYPTLDAIKYIPEIASRLNLNESIKRQAYNLINKTQKNTDCSGKSQKAIATAVLYIIIKKNNLNIRKTTIAKAGDVTTITINNICRFFTKSNNL